MNYKKVLFSNKIRPHNVLYNISKQDKEVFVDQYAGASTFNNPVKKIEASQVFFANRIYINKTSVLLAIDYPFSMCRVFENFLL